ncbi:MAG TPA: hypothetical protein VG897_18035 [Terriglobales bacterium]|nr:hypothetical protein [Terriglobales bacterium]
MLFNDGNGMNGRNGSDRWWQKWTRQSDQELDLADYKRLAIQLHYGSLRPDGLSRSVLVVTPNDSHLWVKGCVTLASCMAEELAQPVLLVDADEQSELRRTLDTPDSAGLANFLSGPGLRLEDMALATSQPNLTFLPQGTAAAPPLSASPDRAKDFLLECTKHWEFVILAGGAVLRNPFALAMSPYVGRVLLLVTENHTPVEDIDAAQTALEQCNARNVSLVFAQFDESIR